MFVDLVLKNFFEFRKFKNKLFEKNIKRVLRSNFGVKMFMICQCKIKVSVAKSLSNRPDIKSTLR